MMILDLLKIIDRNDEERKLFQITILAYLCSHESCVSLEQRIQDIKFWRLELNQKFEEIVQEIETLIIFKSHVERALESCSEPLQVNLQCLTERLIHSVKYYLEKDLQDKFQVERIDVFMCVCVNIIAFTISRSAVTPEEWDSLCNLNISKAEKEKSNSLSLRALVDSLLEQTAADMHTQYEATGRAFELRIEETKTAKCKLELKLLSETANQEKNLESLRVAITEKEAPLKVAQTRLSTRSQRPNVELCHDPAQIRLLEEVKELYVSYALELSEMELKALARRQLSLEEEIQVKTNSLYIDKVICHQLCQPVVIHNF
uniref:Tektin n=1 Tax=Sinocyclocheilus grahami TaxID=75366 RepID=A0A672ME63_SINGR